MNTLLLVELREVVLLKIRMAFDLVSSRHNRRFLDQALQLRFTEVRDADCAGFAAFEALLHGFVGVDVVAVAHFDFAGGVFGEHF